MIELFDFQYKAAAEITDRFVEYLNNRPGRIRGSVRTFIPFYQALASITASGKTIIMAEAVTSIAPLFPVKPMVLWLSKGRVVVAQTYSNLQDGGKYRHLLKDFKVQLLSEYNEDEVKDESLALVYFATVGTFNQKDKEKSPLLLFKSDIDTADESVWETMKQRTTSERVRRPLAIVYDEAHNLTDQQTDLLMELEPDVLLLASATPRLPTAILRVLRELKEALGWDDAKLTAFVNPKNVADSGLVKRQILMGGYQAFMEPIVDDLLSDFAKAEAAARHLKLPLKPKAIYVCKTNIVEGNAFKRDDPKRPFSQRQAPPILIWRYLVEEKGVDPTTIAVYASLDIDRNHRPPADFVLFRGGDKDYDTFVRGDYRHIIFNLGLQEGWDDPLCYFAYIDKSMQSNVQVEQVIGRVLRQPSAQHYESEQLNTARFYVRVDQRGVFGDIVKTVREKLSGDNPEIEFSAYESRERKPIPYPPRKHLNVPHVFRDPSSAKDPIDEVIRGLIDFRGDRGDNVRGRGGHALVQQRVGEVGKEEVIWIEREHGNRVSARWIFQRAVRREFPLALEVTRSDDAKLDAMVELGSPAETHIIEAANRVVELYLEHVRLRQRAHNPYVVGELMGDPTKLIPFKHSVHKGYSGLNKFEKPFAMELDRLRLVWCRNPSQSGFAIPLLSRGQSKYFFPDFLVWKPKTVFALDTTGEHLLKEKVARKLLAVEPHPKSKIRLFVKLVSAGEWNDQVQRVSGGGYTVWSLGHANMLQPVHCGNIAEAVKISLLPDQ